MVEEEIPKGTHLEEAKGSLDMTHQSFYIGLYSPSRQITNWVYTDGSAYDFTNWMQGHKTIIHHR